jgi:outer membrane autotransporter protein
MNGTKKQLAARRALKLSPTTRAIRSALVLSAAMLALAGSSGVAAQSCDPSGTLQVTCNGAFANSVETYIQPVDLVADLTLVIGDDGTTTVVPPAGTTGLTSTWGGDATVISYADVDTYGADGLYMYSDGTATLTNHGPVDTFATGAGQQALDVSALDDVTVVNDGDVATSSTVFSGFGATGIIVRSFDGDASLVNSGNATASAGVFGYAVGISVAADDGYAYAMNTGAVLASGKYAQGLVATGDDVYVGNGYGGSIEAGGKYTTTGIVVSASDSALVDNEGSVYAHGSVANASQGNDVLVTGIDVQTSSGQAGVVNGGDVSATAGGYVSNGVIQATGVDVYSPASTASLVNYGSIVAVGGGYSGMGIHAIGANVATTGEASLANGQYGSILAEATGTTGGTLSAYGANVAGLFAYADADASNDGSISASAEGSAYATVFAVGIQVTSSAGSTSLVNGETGDISASAYGNAYYVQAVGAMVLSADGQASVENAGDITAASALDPAYASYYGAIAAGVIAIGDDGLVVDNAGSIVATATGYGTVVGSHAVGIDANSYSGDIVVTNSGMVAAYSFGDSQYGGSASAIDVSATDGNAQVLAYGIEGVHAYVEYGVAAGVHATVAEDFYLYNDGPMGAEAVYGNAYGVQAHATATYGDIGIVNSGSIYGTSTFGAAWGLDLQADGIYGTIDVDNSGDIAADGYGLAYGVQAVGNSLVLDNAGGTISATAATDGSAGAYAVGVYLMGNYGNVSAYNTGNIGASADGYLGVAMGVFVGAYGGNVYAHNYGGYIDAQAEGVLAVAYGIYATSGLLSARVDNNGSIVASADGDAVAYSFGAYAYASESGSVANGVDGSISASATAYSAAHATGASASGLFSDVFNYGAIAANATADSEAGTASAIGINGFGLFASVYNFGTVDAAASGYVASAVGTYQYAGYAIFHNEGYVTASAEGNVAAYAVGTFIDSYGFFSVDNAGDIIAESSALYAYATGVFASSVIGTIDVYNTGDILATATGAYGLAVGLAVDAYDDVTLENIGSIGAMVDADYGYAYGAVLYSGAGISVDNGGTISARGNAYATALVVGSDGAVTVTNTGTISAYAGATGGGEGSVAIHAVGTGDVAVYNYDTITGAIVTGDGIDTLYNYDGAAWSAVGTSYFGLDDDAIWNYGTIYMSNATIDLGFHGSEGNRFVNRGALVVEGDNAIDMGHGLYTIVPSLNPLPFYNYGTIDFHDGEVGDTLLITGDFASDGSGDAQVDVDASGADAASDVLYIDGSVVAGTVDTINVDLLDLPADGAALVPMVYVTGDSDASNFVLGDVELEGGEGFLTFDFSLVVDIDASNATPDVFLLGIEVGGLSDPGTLAASLAPSMLSLANSQVGTWRQRMGVIDSFRTNAASLWARVFNDKGGFTPEHAAANFGAGGNFDWSQTNSGVEAGMDFALSGQFSLGLLLARTEADTRLRSPGVGSAGLDAESWGLYATWISPKGWYLDASNRWTSFDADLDSVMGRARASGDGETFNLEVGHAWTLANGIQVEPQLQYTRTRIDDLSVLASGSGQEFRAGDLTSSRGRLGLSLRKAFGDVETGWAWTPYATLSAVREFDGRSDYSVNQTLFGSTSVEGTSTLLELGFNAGHANWAVFGGVDWQDGGAVDSFFGGHLGVRYSFGGATAAPAPAAVPVPPAAEPEPAPAPAAPAPQEAPAMEPKPYRG